MDGAARIDDAFVAAFYAGDLDRLISLYEPDAGLMPSPGSVVHGTAAFERGET